LGITPATARSFDALVALMTASPLLRRYGVTSRRARASLSEAMTAGDIVIVAREDGVVVGMAWLVIGRALDGSAYLRLLLVAEERQSQGTGAALLRRIEWIARAKHARHLVLLVTRTNRRARAFYERAGYVHVGDLPDFVRRGIAESLYIKSWRARTTGSPRSVETRGAAPRGRRPSPPGRGRARRRRPSA
jgi:GNAT superfamily N-acetyltransferase